MEAAADLISTNFGDLKHRHPKVMFVRLCTPSHVFTTGGSQFFFFVTAETKVETSLWTSPSEFPTAQRRITEPQRSTRKRRGQDLISSAPSKRLRSGGVTKGLFNKAGTSCHLNAVLQCFLRHNPFLQAPKNDLTDLLVAMGDGGRGEVSSVGIVMKLDEYWESKDAIFAATSLASGVNTADKPLSQPSLS